MHKIVERMLLLSKLENTNNVNVKNDVDIIAIFNDIIEISTTKKKNIKLTLNTELKNVKIKGDHTFIYEAFDNIISNALDFVSDKGQVDINIKKLNKKYEIKITDNGAGIPDYALTRVFEKFYSLPRPGHKNKSSGLGLNITKKIIELHYGTIKIESIQDEFTKIIIEI